MNTFNDSIDSLATHENCTYRWTGEHCDIDNFENRFIVMMIALQQIAVILGNCVFVIWGVRGLAVKYREEKLSLLSLAFVTVYLTLLGIFARIIWMLDPYEYITAIPTMVRDAIFWFSVNCCFGGVVLAYTIWLEVIKTASVLSKKMPFNLAKIACIVFIIVSFTLYYSILAIVLAIEDYACFGLILVLVGVVFTLGFISVHVYFMPKFKKVVNRSFSQKLRDINEYVNWMVLFTNIIQLIGGILRGAIESQFPLSSPTRIFVTLSFEWFFRLKELFMCYWLFKIVLYRNASPITRETRELSEQELE
eukprot:TRINITY_DN5518_c0_g1_i1.p1 TRINITY_DN5518_c0_g1~~TRINITY_DN5518_c0_g1_i1.p1  ORF type:complete len:307 (+),score=38.76 TRINITY_DN5518_c0_g1_i1:3-923(+)